MSAATPVATKRLEHLEDWIDAHVSEAITLGRLCEVAQLGERSLQLDGGSRVITFRDGKVAGTDADVSFKVERRDDWNIVRIGAVEVYKIPDAFVSGVDRVHAIASPCKTTYRGGTMNKTASLCASLVMLAMGSWASSAPCTFSQRQGYIDLDMRNGETYSLAPGNQANHFKDQKDNKVIRTQAGGNTQEFKWEGGKKIIVTFGASTSSSSGGGSAAGAIAVADMSRYCAWGQYGTNAQVFICSFNAEREFLSVDLYRP